MSNPASALYNQLLRLRWPIAAKRIGVLKLDRIGDYILFRDFLPCIKATPIYRDHEIVLIGNDLWRDLAERYDRGVVDRFIWVNRKRFEDERGYRLSIIWQLKKLRVAELIHPTISRDFHAADHLVQCSGAKHKTGHQGDLSNLSAEQKNLADQYYDRLIDNDSGATFELDVYRDFFQQLLPGVDLPLGPSLPVGSPPLATKPYLLLFPGGSEPHKRWPLNHFTSIAAFILQQSEYDTVIAGAPEDKGAAQEIVGRLPATSGRVHNVAGTITLCDLVDWIGNARGLITNDTATVHIAAATKVPTLVLWKGDHVGRFLPYPESLGLPIHTVMPPSLQADIQQLLDHRTGSQQISSLEMESITVQQVKDALKSMLMLDLSREGDQ